MNNNFRSDIINQEFIEKVLKHHEKTVDKIELVEFTSQPGTMKGDNFLGDLGSVTVKANLWNVGETEPTEKSYHWMVKLLKPDPKKGVPNMGRMLGAFEREMLVYRDILPALNEVGTITSCPLIYVDGTEGEEALVLEHMKQHGWRDAANKKKGLTLEFVKLVLDWMAKFHGLCHVMMSRYPGGKDAWLTDNPWAIAISQNPPEFLENFSKTMKEEQKKGFFKIAELLQEGDESKGYVNFLTELFERGFWIDELRKEMQKPKEPFSTINHLDPWFNNMLFKYDGKSDEPTDVLLLDFQIASYTHPGNDLAHFLMTSTTPQFRKKHLDEVLRGYHATLHRVIRDSGIDNFKYTLEDMLNDYRIGQYIGLVFCMFALPMVLAEPDDTVEFAEVDFTDATEMKKFGDLHKENFEKIIKDDSVKERIQGVFEDMMNANIF